MYLLSQRETYTIIATFYLKKVFAAFQSDTTSKGTYGLMAGGTDYFFNTGPGGGIRHAVLLDIKKASFDIQSVSLASFGMKYLATPKFALTAKLGHNLGFTTI